MSTIAQVCAAIVAVGGAVSGIATATDPPPEKLDSAQMPALYVRTGDATWDMSSYLMPKSTRAYRARVAIAPLGQANPPLLESRVRELLIPLVTAYYNAPTLNRVVLQATVSSDGGIVILPEYDAVGFEIVLEVVDVHVP